MQNDAAETLQELAQNPKEIQTVLSGAIDTFVGFLPTLFIAAAILLLGTLLSKGVVKVMQRGLTKTKVDLTIHRFCVSLVRVVLYVLVFTVVLSILGVPTTSLVTVIGAAGLAIGLALQNSLSNLAGGFVILVTKPFRVGDVVEYNGIVGTVHTINILYTHMETPDNKAVFIPNGQVSSGALVNYSYNDIRRVDMVFSVSYASDVEAAKAAIQTVLDRHPMALKEPAAVVRVNNYAASAVEIAVRPWCKQADYLDLRFDLNEQVRKAFEACGVIIPHQQLDIRIAKEQD